MIVEQRFATAGTQPLVVGSESRLLLRILQVQVSDAN